MISTPPRTRSSSSSKSCLTTVRQRHPLHRDRFRQWPRYRWPSRLGWFERFLRPMAGPDSPNQASGFDTSIFDPALIKFYQTEEGQVGLPFAVFPGAMYFIPAMFDEAGLAYPPQKYGDKYKMPDGNRVDWNWDTVTKVAKTPDRRHERQERHRSMALTQPRSFRLATPRSGNPSSPSVPSTVALRRSTPAMQRAAIKSTIPDSWKAAWQVVL